MIKLKTKEDIEVLRDGGEKLSAIMKKLKDAVHPGVMSVELEEMAQELIIKAGGSPAFLGYAPRGDKKYPAALCLSINEAIVHTPASLDVEIKEGDVVSLDLGFKFKGLITDMATSTIAGKDTNNKKQLLGTTKSALEAAVVECREGVSISVVGKKIESIAESAGFRVVRELVGHGVGYDVHEEPVVPNYYDKNMDRVVMEEGLVIAIEPMISESSQDIVLSEDGWTYKTSDNSVAAHFEATIAITKDGPTILTPIV